MNDNFTFTFVDTNSLTPEQIEDEYQLNLEMYPEFAKYYHQNKYYSSIKPQMLLQVRESGKLVAGGKLLWREVKVREQNIKFFGFGMLVRAEYQKQGIGTKMAKLNLEKAQSLGANLLYGTTKNPIVARMLEKLGFKEITTKIIYQDGLTGEKATQDAQAFGFEFQPGLIGKINQLPELFIGTGPV